MADLASLVIKIDSRDASRAKAALDQLGITSKTTEKSVGKLGTTSRNASRGVDSVTNSVGRSSTAARGASSSFSALTAVLSTASAIAAASKFVQVADQMTNLESRIRLTMKATDDYKRIQSQLNQVASNSVTSLQDVGTLYARIAPSVDRLGGSQKDAIDITSALTNALRINGATSAEAGSAILQFSQAMQSGILRGEEFNALNENAGPFLDAMAKQLGVTRGELRGMAADGELTGDVLLNSILPAVEELQSIADTMAVTVSAASQDLSDQLRIAIGELDNMTGATSALSGMLQNATGEVKSFMDNLANSELTEAQQNMIALGGAAAGIATAYASVRAALILLTAAQWAFNAAVRANPLIMGLSVIAAGVAAVYGYAKAADAASGSTNKLANAESTLVKLEAQRAKQKGANIALDQRIAAERAKIDKLVLEAAVDQADAQVSAEEAAKKAMAAQSAAGNQAGKATKLTKDQEKAMKDAAKAADDLANKQKAALQSVQEQIAKFNMSDSEAMMFDFDKLSPNTEQLSQFESYVQELEKLTNQRAELDRFNKTLDDVFDDQEKAADTAAKAADELFGIMQEGVRTLGSLGGLSENAKQLLGVASAAITAAEAMSKLQEAQSKGEISLGQGLAGATSILGAISTAITSLTSFFDGLADFELLVGNLGTGTVFGDRDAQSQSIRKAVEITAENTDISNRFASRMLSSLNQLNENIGRFAASVSGNREMSGAFLGANPSAAASGFKSVSDGLVGVLDAVFFGTASFLGLDKLLGSVGTALFGGKVTGSGLLISPQDIESIRELGLNLRTFVSTSSGVFGGGGTKRKAADPFLTAQFEQIILGAADAVKLAAGPLGRNLDEVSNAVNQFELDIGKISLRKLSAEEIQEKIEAVLSQQIDRLSESAVSGLRDFQRSGEGYFETLIRVANGIESASLATDRLGVSAINYADILNKQGDVATEIIRQSVLLADTSPTVAGGFREIVSAFQGTGDEITDLVLQLRGLQDALTAAGQNADFLTTTMIAGAGGVDRLTEGLQSYFDDFLSPAEQAGELIRRVGAEFQSLGIVAPSGTQAFRELVSAIDISTQEGQKLFGQVVALAPAFSQAQQSIESAAQALVNESQAAADAQISAINEVRRAAEQSLASARAALTSAFSAESRELSNTISEFDRFIVSLRDFRESLGLTIAQTQNGSLSASRTQFTGVANRARLGDTEAMAVLPNIGRQFVEASSNFSSSREDYIRDLAFAQKAAADAEAVAGRQKSIAQQQLDSLTDQVTALGVLNESVLTVAEAIVQFKAAQTALASAGNSIASGSQAVLTLQEARLKVIGDALSNAINIQDFDLIVETLNGGFSILDANLDGLLTGSELRSALAGKATDSQLNGIIAAIDQNGDGMISQVELVKFGQTDVVRAVQNVEAAIRSQAAQVASGVTQGVQDSGKDITQADFKTILQQAAGAKGISTQLVNDAFANSLFTQLDTNRNNRIRQGGDNNEYQQSVVENAINQLLLAQNQQPSGGQNGGQITQPPPPPVTPVNDPFNVGLSAFTDRQAFNLLRQNGYTNIERNFNKRDDKIAELSRIGYYATGGMHSGGWRVVGENGPELEYTGPSRIFNAGQTSSVLSNDDMRQEMAAMRQEMKAALFVVAKNTDKTARQLERWDGDGLPEERSA